MDAMLEDGKSKAREIYAAIIAVCLVVVLIGAVELELDAAQLVLGVVVAFVAAGITAHMVLNGVTPSMLFLDIVIILSYGYFALTRLCTGSSGVGVVAGVIAGTLLYVGWMSRSVFGGKEE